MHFVVHRFMLPADIKREEHSFHLSFWDNVLPCGSISKSSITNFDIYFLLICLRACSSEAISKTDKLAASMDLALWIRSKHSICRWIITDKNLKGVGSH